MSYNNLLRQTVGIKTRSGNSDFGDKEFGSAVDHDARVELIDEEIFDVSGKIVRARARIFMLPTATVTPNDRAVLPGGGEEDILRVEDVPGGNGSIHHKEVLV